MPENTTQVARKWFTLGALVGLATAFAITLVLGQWGGRLGILSGIVFIGLLLPMVVIQRWLYASAQNELEQPERRPAAPQGGTDPHR